MLLPEGKIPSKPHQMYIFFDMDNISKPLFQWQIKSLVKWPLTWALIPWPSLSKCLLTHFVTNAGDSIQISKYPNVWEGIWATWDCFFWPPYLEIIPLKTSSHVPADKPGQVWSDCEAAGIGKSQDKLCSEGICPSQDWNRVCKSQALLISSWKIKSLALSLLKGGAFPTAKQQCVIFPLCQGRKEKDNAPDSPHSAGETVNLFSTTQRSTGWKNSSTASPLIILQRALVKNILLLMYLHRLEAEKLLTTGAYTQRFPVKHSPCVCSSATKLCSPGLNSGWAVQINPKSPSWTQSNGWVHLPYQKHT